MNSSTSADGATELKPSIYDLLSGIYHDLHRNEIRLVKLLQGEWSDKICCQLYHTSLANKPSYKALSYAWGSPRATRPILVNGHQHSVTINLECALRRLRRIDSDLTLCVDALCINQRNRPERTEQVNLMHDIFAFTEEVVVYLGEVQHQGSTASKESLPSSNFSYDDSDSDMLEAFHTKYQRGIFEGLRQLLLCRWWNRIWVIQEVVVPQKVTVVYGPATAPWDMFVDAARWESRNRAFSTPLSFPNEYSIVLAYFSRIILDIDNMRELWRAGKLTALLPLLRRFNGRQASDARDKVYGLLSLARNGTSIVPDYSLTVPTLFQSTVLDIINNMKRLNVVAGDLGRKDRQDLPSWVPDWSAAYDDLDRRRAENTGDFRAAGESFIYVQDEEAREWSGIRRHLGIPEPEFAVKAPETPDYVKKLSDILGTSEWVERLSPPIPGGDSDFELSEEDCLATIENFWTERGTAVCLQNHGSGVIGLSGFQVDRIAAAGETALSDDVLLSTIGSWVDLLAKHFPQCVSGLGDGFRRMLCADTLRTRSDSSGFTTRRISNDDHSQIATWLLQGPDSDFKNNPAIAYNSRREVLEELFQDLGGLSSYMAPNPIAPVLDAAIRTATVRRAFFITDKGYIGLGPRKLRVGDHLYILLGGQTPFILRPAGTRSFLERPIRVHPRNIRRPCSSMIGDCYTDGLMSGEAMSKWAKIVDKLKNDTVLRALLDQYSTCDHYLRIYDGDSFDFVKIHAGGNVLLKQIRDFHERRGYASLQTPEKQIFGLSNIYEHDKLRYISELCQWSHRKHPGQDLILEIALRKGATALLEQSKHLTQTIDIAYPAYFREVVESARISGADIEHQMDKVRERIDQQDVNIAQQGRMYLV